MSDDTITAVGNSHALGRKPKSTPDEIIRLAWGLFEKNGYESTTMADVAAAAGISRRTLFNYFPTKEALLYPNADEYMAEFSSILMSRPRDEPLFQSLEYCILHCGEFKKSLEDKFDPGPLVHEARLSDSAVRYSRDYWARLMEDAVARRLADEPGGAAQAGFVGALAAQVWTEMAKHLKSAGPKANMDDALETVMSSLRLLFTA